MTGPALMTDRYLYRGTALLLTAIVFLAFTRTFWTPLSAGSLTLHPTVVVHALLFFLWMVFFVVQTWLPPTGRTGLHRDLGLFGIALASAMVFSGLLAAIVSVKAGLAGPRPDVARTATVLSFSGMTLFSTFIVLGLANLRKPEHHKRYLVLATFSILQSAVARIIMLFPAILLPQRIVLGAVIVDLLLATVICLDARARGRFHPVYLGGAAFIVSIQYLRVQLLHTDAWVEFCDWLAAIAG